MTDKPFEREIRYVVVKLSHLRRDDATLGTNKETVLREFLARESINSVASVVVEADWPEYDVVWNLIERRTN